MTWIIDKKIQLVALFTLVALQAATSREPKSKRGSYEATFSGWKAPVSASSGGFVPIPVLGNEDFIHVELPSAPIPNNPGVIVSNSIEKPVMESQEYVPPQSFGSVILPQMRQPATPVNAAGANVPANQGAVFLGSGSIGVVNLGGGAYALGSGSIGYSGNRAQTRPSERVPVYPPLPASPNLIPAAVPSPAPAQPFPPVAQIPNSIDYNIPYGVPQVPQYDQNGYEYLPPDRVGFGMPLPPRPPRVRNQYATPSLPQVPQSLPQLSYDFGIPLAHPTAPGISSLG